MRLWSVFKPYGTYDEEATTDDDLIWVSDLKPVLLSILIFICLGSSSFIHRQTMTDLLSPKGSKIESPLWSEEEGIT